MFALVLYSIQLNSVVLIWSVQVGWSVQSKSHLSLEIPTAAQSLLACLGLLLACNRRYNCSKFSVGKNTFLSFLCESSLDLYNRRIIVDFPDPDPAMKG